MSENLITKSIRQCTGCSALCV